MPKFSNHSIINFKLINDIISYARDNSSFYKNLYRDIQYPVRDLESFIQLPFINKNDLPAIRSSIKIHHKASRLYWTGGTSGISTPIEWYDTDFIFFANLIDNLFDELRIKPGMYVLSTIGNPMGQLGEFIHRVCNKYNLVNITVPASDKSFLPMLLKIIQNEPISILIATPQGALRIFEKIKEDKIKQNLKLIITSGAPLPLPMWKTLKKWSKAEVRNLFGCTEAGGLGFSCSAGPEIHVDPRFVFVECLNNNIGNLDGNLVITSLINHRQPIIRYRTGDICEIDTGTCDCGSNWPKLRFIQRCSDTVFIGGSKFSTEEVDSVLEKLNNSSPYQIVYSENKDDIPEIDLRLFGNHNYLKKEVFLKNLMDVNLAVYTKICSGAIKFNIQSGNDIIPFSGKGDKYLKIVKR